MNIKCFAQCLEHISIQERVGAILISGSSIVSTASLTWMDVGVYVIKYPV